MIIKVGGLEPLGPIGVYAYVYNVLRALADTIEKLPITLFDELSFGCISQSVYLLQQRKVSSRPLAHLADVFM